MLWVIIVVVVDVFPVFLFTVFNDNDYQNVIFHTPLSPALISVITSSPFRSDWALWVPNISDNISHHQPWPVHVWGEGGGGH